jgi:hypothetical protein
MFRTAMMKGLGILIAGAIVAGGVYAGATGKIPTPVRQQTAVKTEVRTEAGVPVTSTAGKGYGSRERGGGPPSWAGKGKGQGGVGAYADQTIYSLTDAEKEKIVYMVEEEKMARDVYKTLYDKWGLQVFANIARSEQMHMDSVLYLIEKYGLENPVQDEVGKFTNPDIQALYDQLVAQGSKSVVDALKVGALIEEVDIKDLDEAIAEAQAPDVVQIFENLRSGSYNHLRAFTSVLETYGVDYTPQILSPERYQEIVSGGGPGRRT